LLPRRKAVPAIDEDLRRLVFEFFFWASRFESALKESGWLQSNAVSAPTCPDWLGFALACAEGRRLITFGRAIMPKAQTLNLR
jgi:hypothetical protein